MATKELLFKALAELNEASRFSCNPCRYELNFAYGAYALQRYNGSRQLPNDELCTNTRMTSSEMYMYIIGAIHAMQVVNALLSKQTSGYSVCSDTIKLSPTRFDK